MTTFVKAIEGRFGLTRDRIYRVDNGCLRDDMSILRDAGGLVVAGAATWCDVTGQNMQAPAPLPFDQHYAGIYDTEVILLTTYARNHSLPLAIIVDAGRTVVSISASPWAAQIILGARRGIQQADAVVRANTTNNAR